MRELKLFMSVRYILPNATEPKANAVCIDNAGCCICAIVSEYSKISFTIPGGLYKSLGSFTLYFLCIKAGACWFFLSWVFNIELTVVDISDLGKGGLFC